MHHHVSDFQNEKGLRWALWITLFIIGLEIAGWWLSNSLSLLSDAGHMAGDAFSLLLSLFAFRLGKKPSTSNYSFGYGRAEVLASWVNGWLLIAYSVWVIGKAVYRWIHPLPVLGMQMMLIAAIGLMANLLSLWFLRNFSDVEHNLNVKSAYLHVWADASSSIAVLFSSLSIYFAGWTWTDSFVSIAVSLVMLRGGWRVFSESTRMIMEGIPSSISVEEIKHRIQQHPDVLEIKRLYMWSISSQKDCLAFQVVVQKDSDEQKILRDLKEQLSKWKPWHVLLIEIEKK